MNEMDQIEEDAKREIDELDTRHKRAKTPAARKTLEEAMKGVRNQVTKIRELGDNVNVAIDSLRKIPIRLRVDLEIKSGVPGFTEPTAEFIIRGVDDWSRCWLDTTPELPAILQQLHQSVAGRPITRDGARVFSSCAVFRSQPIRDSETPRTLAFYLSGSLRRRFPHTNFEVDPR